MVKLKLLLALFIVGLVAFDSVESQRWTWEDLVSDFTGDRFKPKRPPRVYKKLTVNRKMFYYWDESYKPWTNWSICDPIKCIKTRYRECVDKSWQEYVRNFKTEIKCPVKFLHERKQCNDTIECQIVEQNKTMLNTTDFPDTCGIRPREVRSKIVGGVEAMPNSWPWHVGIYARHSMYFCGGTLINSGWVITAAHCFVSLKGLEKLKPGKLYDMRTYNLYNSFHGILGDHNRYVKTKFEKSIRFSHMIIHPKLFMSMSSQAYDVVMLKLNEKIVPNRQIGFSCLPSNINDTIRINQRCIAIGWGNTKPLKPFPVWAYEFFDFDSVKRSGMKRDKYKRRNINVEHHKKDRRQQWNSRRRYRDERRRRRRGNRYFSGRRRNAVKLQEVEVNIHHIKVCKRQYPFSNLNNKIHLCAGANVKDTCSGDSGGGLFCINKLGRWQLTGITSFGSNRGCGNANGVYMKITSVIDWIQNVVKKYE